MIQNITALPDSLMVLLRSLLYSTNDDGKRRHMKTSSNDHRTLDILFKPSVSDPLSTLLMWKRPNKDLRYNKERSPLLENMDIGDKIALSFSKSQLSRDVCRKHQHE